jgi:hypothetical protein
MVLSNTKFPDESGVTATTRISELDETRLLCVFAAYTADGV